MRVTQNDLSADLTKLDYQALVETAQIAFVKCREELNRLMHKTYEINFTKGCFYLTSEDIAKTAGQFNTVCETLHTLTEGLERSQLEIVNKPDVERR